MRIFFIPGFGENKSIFHEIAPSIGGEQIFLNLWELLGNTRREELNVLNFAKELVEKFDITSADWVIGHSMGGWVAYHIKHFSNCRIIQIASWTNFDRVISPIRSGKFIYWLIRKGLYMNDFQKWLFTKFRRGTPSLYLSKGILADLVAADKESVINQLKLIFEPVPAISAIPDLRIHALKDLVIKPPKEAFSEVSGDHFTLVLHPQEVIDLILKAMRS